MTTITDKAARKVSVLNTGTLIDRLIFALTSQRLGGGRYANGLVMISVPTAEALLDVLMQMENQ